ncbi:MAG TPA: class II fructose-bisphosphate aldolase [Terriglobia bacterium]|nr:class II fructose-bisphosphate aldolase [Terriglobia bacterium]
MRELRDVLEQTQKNGVAVGHFNIADLVLLKAVFASAQELKVPVLVGVSEVCARNSISRFFSTQIIRIPS